MTPSQHLYTAAALFIAASLALVVGEFWPARLLAVAGVGVGILGVRK